MTIDSLTKEIDELNRMICVLQMPIQNDIHFIFKTYIETEKLSETKRIIDEHGILQENGNKYQFNDISELIDSNPKEVDKETKKLAQKILRRNKVKR